MVSQGPNLHCPGLGAGRNPAPWPTYHTRGAAASPCIHHDLLSSYGAGDAYRVLTPIAARVPMPTTLRAPFPYSLFYNKVLTFSIDFRRIS